MGSIKSKIGKSIGPKNGQDKKEFLQELMDSMHAVSRDELLASRNPMYTYMI